MRAVAKILRARASEHSFNVCEKFEHRPNFASTFKLNGTIWYPWKKSPVRTGFIERIHSRVQQPCKIYWNKRKCLHTSSSHWEVSAAVKGVLECKYDNENFNKNILILFAKWYGYMYVLWLYHYVTLIMAQDAPKRRFLSLIFLVSCISKSLFFKTNY